MWQTLESVAMYMDRRVSAECHVAPGCRCAAGASEMPAPLALGVGEVEQAEVGRRTGV